VLHSLIEKLSNYPGFFLFCRGVLEANFKAIHRIIHEWLPPKDGRKVLDLACGPGAFSKLFTPENYSGIDINDQYIRYAQEHHRGSFAVMDARDLKFPSRTFDDVLVFGLLHHLDDRDATAVVTSLARVLKPEGRALIIEDIPTRSKLNVIGHLIHNIENGHHIRPPAQYHTLLSPHFRIEDERTFRSGVCDYYAVRVAPLPATA
jgi:ubiquinone/menaquinone biosynthesis C-methylase UbiE